MTCSCRLLLCNYVVGVVVVVVVVVVCLLLQYLCVCVYYCSTYYKAVRVVPIIKPFAWGEGDIGGHVLRETV
jgi:hypothetical protein